jgi:hypothetical protein
MVKNMNSSKTLYILLMVACATAWQIYPVQAEQYTPLLSVSAENVYITAGQENEIEIKLKNTGGFNVYQVSATLSTTTPGISVISGAHRIYNKIEEGETETIRPVLYVDRNTLLGAYTLTFEVSYLKTFQTGDLLPEYASVQIGVVVDSVVKPEVRLDVGLEGVRLETGAEDDAGIWIENIGKEPIYEVDARIISNSPYIVVLEGARFTGGDLDPGDRVGFESRLGVSRNAPLGVYTLTASVSYEDGDGQVYQEAFTLGVTVDSIRVAKQTSVILTGYETSPDEINPGDIVDLRLELTCLEADAHDVKASLYLDPLTGISTMSPTLVALSDMKPGESMEASYRLIVGGSLGAGQYPATITVTYLDADGVPGSLVEVVTLRVVGIVEFRLINVGSVTAERGGKMEFEADLLLIGTESIQFVVIEVVEDENFRITSESEEYIGAVDPDSPIPFDLEFEVAEEAGIGDHALTVKVTYTDDLNQDHEDTIELPVTVTELSSGATSSTGSPGGFWTWLRRLFGLMP